MPCNNLVIEYPTVHKLIEGPKGYLQGYDLKHLSSLLNVEVVPDILHPGSSVKRVFSVCCFVGLHVRPSEKEICVLCHLRVNHIPHLWSPDLTSRS